MRCLCGAGKCAAAEAAAAASASKVERLEELSHTLQREVSLKGCSLARLEDQAGRERGVCVGGGAGVLTTWRVVGLCRQKERQTVHPIPCLQLAAARKEAGNREQAAASAEREACERQAEQVAGLELRAATAEAAAGQAAAEAAAARQQCVQEAEALEARFRALLQTKNSTIAALTRQLQELCAEVE